MSRLFVRLIHTSIVCITGNFFAFQVLGDQPATPQLSSVQPFVIQVGATNTLVLEGKHLEDFKGLWTSRHGVIPSEELRVDINAEGTRATLKLVIRNESACGPFAIRWISGSGISDPNLAFLEVLPRIEPDGNRIVQGTGYVLGTISEPSGVTFAVHLKKGEELPIDVFAGRLGSKIDPVMIIYADDLSEELYLHDSPGVGVDCWHVFKAPKNGKYIINVRDARYGSGVEYRYLVRFGHANNVVSPTAQGRSNFPLSAHTTISVPDKDRDAFFQAFQKKQLATKPLALAVERVPISVEEAHDSPIYFLSLVTSNRVGRLGFQRESSMPEQVYGATSLNGSFRNPDELIQLELKITDVGRYRWTAISRRLGGWSDPALRLRTKDGHLLAESHLFNNESTLSHEFQEAGSYILELWDVAGQFGPHANFHIHAQKDPAKFELNTEVDSIRVEIGGESNLKLDIDRDGYNGPVKFVITTFVEGVSLNDAIAKKNSKETTIKVALAETLIPGTTFPIKISGLRGENTDAPRSPLYTQAYWKKSFRDLYSPMFEFEDTIWVTVLAKQDDEESEEKNYISAEPEG